MAWRCERVGSVTVYTGISLLITEELRRGGTVNQVQYNAPRRLKPGGR